MRTLPQHLACVAVAVGMQACARGGADDTATTDDDAADVIPDMPQWALDAFPEARKCVIEMHNGADPENGYWTLLDKDGWPLAFFSHGSGSSGSDTGASEGDPETYDLQVIEWRNGRTKYVQKVYEQVGTTLVRDGEEGYTTTVDDNGRTVKRVAETITLLTAFDGQGRRSAWNDIYGYSLTSDGDPVYQLARLTDCTADYPDQQSIGTCTGPEQACERDGGLEEWDCNDHEYTSKVTRTFDARGQGVKIQLNETALVGYPDTTGRTETNKETTQLTWSAGDTVVREDDGPAWRQRTFTSADRAQAWYDTVEAVMNEPSGMLAYEDSNGTSAVYQPAGVCDLAKLPLLPTKLENALK